MRIVHRVGVSDSAVHLVSVETRLSANGPLPSPLEFFMAVWTPGSYLVREYSRHVEGVSSNGRVRKTAKNSWIVEHDGLSEVTIRYRVYCNDLTVRTNHADATHVYLNGASTFLALRGYENQPCEVEIDAPPDWNVATPMTAEPTKKNGFTARNFDELVDSPIEIGTFREFQFEAANTPHRFAVWPRASLSDENANRLVKDTKTIIEAEANLFGGLPHEGYTFLLHLSPRGRGGLEHMTSSTLLAPENAPETRDGWLDLLSLIAHEYFHLWNIKRIRPSGLTPYRYEEENYTRLLWWFEGATSYFDWRILRLANLCTTDEYLHHLASEITYVEQTPGRLVQALEETSFDAWIKLYRPDENSQNSTISYYRKGELVVAMLDLEIRARSHGTSNLDRVVAALWERFGSQNKPVPEDGLQGFFEEVTSCKLDDLFESWIRGRTELDTEKTFALAGLSVERQTKGTASIAARLANSGGRILVNQVTRGGAAQRAGIDPGDELISIGDRRVEGVSLDSILASFHQGAQVAVVVSRDGRLRRLTMTLDGARLDKIKLAIDPKATADAVALRGAWLGKL